MLFQSMAAFTQVNLFGKAQSQDCPLWLVLSITYTHHPWLGAEVKRAPGWDGQS